VENISVKKNKKTLNANAGVQFSTQKTDAISATTSKEITHKIRGLSKNQPQVLNLLLKIQGRPGPGGLNVDNGTPYGEILSYEKLFDKIFNVYLQDRNKSNQRDIRIVIEAL